MVDLCLCYRSWGREGDADDLEGAMRKCHGGNENGRSGLCGLILMQCNTMLSDARPLCKCYSNVYMADKSAA